MVLGPKHAKKKQDFGRLGLQNHAQTLVLCQILGCQPAKIKQTTNVWWFVGHRPPQNHGLYLSLMQNGKPISSGLPLTSLWSVNNLPMAVQSHLFGRDLHPKPKTELHPPKVGNPSLMGVSMICFHLFTCQVPYHLGHITLTTMTNGGCMNMLCQDPNPRIAIWSFQNIGNVSK